MNISYKWLKQYLDFNLTPDKTSEILTSLGLEVGSVERVETIKGGLRGLVVGEVLTCVEHPNSDHLHITTVRLAPDQEPVQIVCGAPNVAAGQKVIVATIGTKLYDGDNEFTIKRGKIRGEESLGMICAEDEIGVGTSHDGIIVLPADAVVGTPAADYYGVEDDYLIEVDLTPNRIDAASHYGVARDLAAWLSVHQAPVTAHRPSVDAFAADRADGAVTVTVENAEACPRYSGLTIRGVKVQESPKWLKDLLLAVGQRPINNIVDITNYILLGTGQPMHCFDLAHVAGEHVIVKTVAAGTKFVTLDEVERTLDARDLMICNEREPMCIAGVFGGKDSGVTEDTTDIFLESACFHPTWVRKTARRHALNTDSSFRFERGLDANATIYNLKLAALLVKELAGGEICGDIVDIKAQDSFPGWPVTLCYDYVDSLIGKQLPREVIRNIVTGLEMEIAGEDETGLSLVVPRYRVDVQRPCDVVEDILRVYGYNNVEAGTQFRTSLSAKGDVDFEDDMQEFISNRMSAIGYREFMNNSLTPAAYYEGNEVYPAERCVRIMNPLSSDLNVMRQTLLYGGLESIARNINHKNANLSAYEFGNVYSYDGSAAGGERALAPYSEHRMMALWLTGNNHDAAWADATRAVNVFDLKGDLEGLLSAMGIDLQRELNADPDSDALLESALRYRDRGGNVVATLGVVDADVLKKADIDQPVFYAEVDWHRACRLAARRDIKYADLPKTLPIKRDLALLVDTAVTYADIERVVRDTERKLLRDITLFDVYESKKLEAGKKSYAISMTLQDDAKTLNDKQIDGIMTRVIKALQDKLGATLR